MKRVKRHKQKGSSTLELALVLPIAFFLFLAFVQVVIYMQSLIATEYAAFTAARSFQVYGDQKLQSIHYPHTRAEPFTNKSQSIAEAAAEKVLFESLLWEQKRIRVDGDEQSLARVYEDGNQDFYERGGFGQSRGSVYVEYKGCNAGNTCANGKGVEVHYCLPIVFPGISFLFGNSKKQWPCKGQALGRVYEGIAISRSAFLGREPLDL